MELVELANLEATRQNDMRANPALSNNWIVVKDWSEKARYETKTQLKAEKLYDAITDDASGVMPWIRVRW